MDWLSIKRELSSSHTGRMQDLALIEAALRDIINGVETLGRLGHQFHLAPGPGPDPSETWPRLFFSIAKPQGQAVNNEEEKGNLGEGWFDTLADAQHADGMLRQFAGRGGVTRRDLPVILTPEPTEEERLLARETGRQSARARILKERGNN